MSKLKKSKKPCCLCGSMKWTQYNKKYGNYLCCLHNSRYRNKGNFEKGERTFIPNEIEEKEKEIYIILNKKRIKTVIDKEDYEKVKNIRWSYSLGYAIGHPRKNITLPENENNKNIRLSRLIMNFPKNLFIDHINQDKLDNRKSNLRVVTASQNAMNSKINIKNKTGFAGVKYNKKKEYYIATISINKRHFHLYHGKSLEDAVYARKQAEKKYFKEYAPLEGRDINIGKPKPEKIKNICFYCNSNRNVYFRVKYNKYICNKHNSLLNEYGSIPEKVEISRTCRECNSSDNLIFNRKLKFFLCKNHARQYYKYGKIYAKKERLLNSITEDNNYIFISLFGSYDKKAIIDKEDYEKVKNIRWFFNNFGKYVYGYELKNKKAVYLSRLLLNVDKNQGVIHINRNNLDNRKENLKIVPKNLSFSYGKKSKTGCIGVKFIEKSKKYQANININGKNMYLYYGDSLDEAIKARKDAEKSFYGIGKD